jgi:hypothetical protein
MTWPELLQALEDSLSGVERGLVDGVWDLAATSWALPPAPLAPPCAEEGVRLQELAARGEFLRLRLEAAMADISAQLDGTRRLREGAHEYLMTQNLTSSR